MTLDEKVERISLQLVVGFSSMFIVFAVIAQAVLNKLETIIELLKR